MLFLSSNVIYPLTWQVSNLALNQDLSTILVFAICLTGNFCMMTIIDRLGRRRCLMVSLAVLVAAYTVLGWSLRQSSPADLAPATYHYNQTDLLLPVTSASIVPVVDETDQR